MDDKPFKLSPTFNEDLAAGIKRFDEAKRIDQLEVQKALLREYQGLTTTLKEKAGISLVMPNADTTINGFTICTAEAMISAYVKSIGKTIEFANHHRKVLSVKVTETEIIVEFDVQTY